MTRWPTPSSAGSAVTPSSGTRPNRNREEREGQLNLFDADFRLQVSELASSAADIDALSDDDVGALREKEAATRDYLTSDLYQRARLAADAWCAAFLAAKTKGGPEITTSLLRLLEAGHSGSIRGRTLVSEITISFAPFHWQLEFAPVFARGGFDVVLGNPPWDRVKVRADEFFAARHPGVAAARNAAERNRLISALRDTDPALHAAYHSAVRRAEAESHFLRDSGVYPLTARGDINTYAVFAERVRAIVGPRGRAGVIVPSGIATDATTQHFFGAITENRQLASLYDMGEMGRWFPDVGGLLRFCLMTLSGTGAPVDRSDFVFHAHTLEELRDNSRHFSLADGDLALLNPNTRTCPMFRSQRDAEIAIAVYGRVPVLVRLGDETGNPWGMSALVMFDMALDSHLFSEVPNRQAVRLYEAKMMHQYDHRYGDYALATVIAGKGVRQLPTPSVKRLLDPDYSVKPRYWIAGERVRERLAGRWSREWLLSCRRIAGATNERTVIAAVLPLVGIGHSAMAILTTDPLGSLLLANLNSLALDWQARQKVGGMNFSLFVMEQLPVLPPAVYRARPSWCGTSLGEWMRPYVGELTYTATDVRAYAIDLGWEGPPFAWDDVRRLVLRSELDAAYFHLYGHPRDEVEHILNSFTTLREREEKEFGSFRTQEQVLVAYDAMAVATPDSPFRSSLSRLPGTTNMEPPSGGYWRHWRQVLEV